MTPVKNHIRAGRCPKCGKYRTLDHVAPVKTGGSYTRYGDTPKNPTKPKRVCAGCAR